MVLGGRGCPGMNRLKMRRLSRSVMKGLPKGCSRGSTEFPTCMSCPLTSDPAARWSWCTHLRRRQPGVASPRSPFSTRAGKDISGDRDAPPFAASNSRWRTLQMRLSWQRGGRDEWLGLQVKAQRGGVALALGLGDANWAGWSGKSHQWTGPRTTSWSTYRADKTPVTFHLDGNLWQEIPLSHVKHMYYTSVLTSGKQEWCCRLLLHVKILILAINISPGLCKTHAAWRGKGGGWMFQPVFSLSGCSLGESRVPHSWRRHEETPPTQTYGNEPEWTIFLSYPWVMSKLAS